MDAETALSILEKIIKDNEGFDGMYVDLWESKNHPGHGSLCLDGTVYGLTPKEIDLLKRLGAKEL